MTVFASRADRRRFVLAAVAVLVGVTALLGLVRTYAPFLTDGPAMREYVAGFGVLAPLVFVLLQALQVVLAPIPGQVTGFASGYLFGTVPGTVYSLIGLTIGSFAAFWLSRRFGRPFVRDVIHDDLIEQLDGFVADAGLVSLFVVFLIPGPPDDVVCFLAGLTEIDLWKLVVVAILGRAPGYLLVNLFGASLAEEEFGLFGVLLFVFVVAGVWSLLHWEQILEFVRQR